MLFILVIEEQNMGDNCYCNHGFFAHKCTIIVLYGDPLNPARPGLYVNECETNLPRSRDKLGSVFRKL